MSFNLNLPPTQKKNLQGVRFEVDELVTIWEMCRYETAYAKDVFSPWCNLLSDEALKVFAFREDLSTFYYKGMKKIDP